MTIEEVDECSQSARDEAASSPPFEVPARPASGGASTPLLRRLAGQRIVQFAVLGGALFAIAPRPRSNRDIDISGERLAALHVAEVARSGSPSLDRQTAQAIDQRALEDELLYREAVRLGLDKNDGIVRQRLVQKVLFLAEELGGASRPANEGELEAFFAKNRDRWAIGEHLHVEQIYRHDPEALAAWSKDPKDAPPPRGEPCPISSELDTDVLALRQSLGDGFADALASAPTGQWVGPVQSVYGYHLVRVVERRKGRPAELREVRAAVVEAFSVHRRQEATAAFLTSAFARYHVAVDGMPLTGFEPSRRIAYRSAPSGED